jgi:hypothetical protein
MEPIVISSIANWKKIIMEIPRDASTEDYIDSFNTMLKFNWRWLTLQDMLYEEISEKVYWEINKEE